MGNNVNITCFAIFDGGQEVGKWAIVKRRLTLCTNNEYDFYRNTYAFSESTIQIARIDQKLCEVLLPLQHVLG